MWGTFNTLKTFIRLLLYCIVSFRCKLSFSTFLQFFVLDSVYYGSDFFLNSSIATIGVSQIFGLIYLQNKKARDGKPGKHGSHNNGPPLPISLSDSFQSKFDFALLTPKLSAPPFWNIMSCLSSCKRGNAYRTTIDRYVTFVKLLFSKEGPTARSLDIRSHFITPRLLKSIKLHCIWRSVTKLFFFYLFMALLIQKLHLSEMQFWKSFLSRHLKKMSRISQYRQFFVISFTASVEVLKLKWNKKETSVWDLVLGKRSMLNWENKAQVPRWKLCQSDFVASFIASSVVRSLPFLSVSTISGHLKILFSSEETSLKCSMCLYGMTKPFLS